MPAPRAAWTITAVSIDHYENFPVASLLCPPALRPAVSAIYWFARTADDIADEGDADAATRLAALAAYRTDLLGTLSTGAPSSRWPKVFAALHATLQAHPLPPALLLDLLSAFEQDVQKHTYADRAELLDYCRRSANPVGRLLLQLYGVHGSSALRQSDAICTALQLINFWQDLGVDTRRGRLYVPATDCERFGMTATALLQARSETPALRALVSELVNWARALMLDGAPLVHTVPGRAGWELRLVVQGGLRILDKIEALQFATIETRPALRWYDSPVLFWRALWMRAPAAMVAKETA
jgi:hydroxysqualene synthase